MNQEISNIALKNKEYLFYDEQGEERQLQALILISI